MELRPALGLLKCLTGVTDSQLLITLSLIMVTLLTMRVDHWLDSKEEEWEMEGYVGRQGKVEVCETKIEEWLVKY